jgi:putative phosphoribosyl transferase
MRFLDRREAGRRLAEHLRESAAAPAVVLGVARGGAVVAREVAAALHAEFGVVVVRKVTPPWNHEYAVGAVAAGVPPWLDHARIRDLRVEFDHVAAESERQERECVRLEREYARFGSPEVEGRAVLVVDDALATGATAIAAIRRVRFLEPASIEVAAPVVSPAAFARMTEQHVKLHTLAVEPNFAWAGAFYDEFDTVDDEEVCRLLSQSHDARPVGVRPFTVERDGLALRSVVELPDGSGPFPAVILVHGSGDTKESPSIVALAQRLRSAGFATVRFDASGCGESSPSREPEPIRCMHDLAAVFAWALRSPDLDRRRVAIYGEGLGAWVALRAAVDGRVGPAALALCAPPLQRPDLATLDVPCLLVIGEQDTNLAGVVAAASTNRCAKLEIVAGAGHRLAERGALESAARLTTRWLSETLTTHALGATP